MKDKAAMIGSILLALAFFFFGATKFMGSPETAQMFSDLGLPSFMVYVTGIMEVGAGVLLLLPAMRFYGALLVVVTMIGALGAHITSGAGMEMLPMAIIFLVFGGAMAWLNKPGDAAEAAPAAEPAS